MKMSFIVTITIISLLVGGGYIVNRLSGVDNSHVEEIIEDELEARTGVKHNFSKTPEPWQLKQQNEQKEYQEYKNKFPSK